ncbi:hypothetical protein KKF38_02220, partial [Patescibacteria group bacterium]|nr:hypothetical protein [Patescibacteria group bacterium]
MRVYALTVTNTKMTFSELAVAAGLSSGALRVNFSRHKWSIHSPENIHKFLVGRLSGRKPRRSARPYQTGAHIQKWRFVKKVKQAEVSPLAEKIKILEEKLAQESALAAEKERKIAVLMRQNSELKIQTRRGRACPPLAPPEETVVENIKTPEKTTEPEIPIVENIVEPITPETPEPKPAPIPEPKPET